MGKVDTGKDRALIVSVGGAPAPIIQAITDHAPALVVFVTSKATVANSRSSTEQIEREIIPRFPALTTSHEIIEVDLDDLMDVYTKCCAVILQYQAGYELIADYTGGTKTMSSGLVLAVSQFPNVALSLVQGKRHQLVALQNIPVNAVTQPQTALRAEERLQMISMLFDMHEYHAAVDSARQFLLVHALEVSQRNQWIAFKDVLLGYANWDNFDHHSAFTLLKAVLPEINTSSHKYLGALTVKDRATGYELVHDLVANAGRRAQQGRYDDAAARMYRALEAFAQARFKTEYAVGTSAIPAHLITARAIRFHRRLWVRLSKSGCIKPTSCWHSSTIQWGSAGSSGGRGSSMRSKSGTIPSSRTVSLPLPRSSMSLSRTQSKDFSKTSEPNGSASGVRLPISPVRNNW